MSRVARGLVLAAVTVVALGVAPVAAQTAPVPGEVTGSLRALDASVPLGGVPVTLLVVRDAGIVSLETTTDDGGTFRFEVEANPSITYLASATLEGVQYWSPVPALLSPELPSAAVEVVVASTTTTQPELRVESTTVTALALDRANEQLVFAREDLLVNPGTQTYVPLEGVSVRVPVPDATLQAGGEAFRDGLPAGGTVTLEGATMAASVPVRPGATTITTRYLVAYDAALDEYTLRFTAPLPTASMRVEIPESFVRSTSMAEGVRRSTTTVEGQRMLVFEASDLPPGRGVVVTLLGLAGVPATNPLTSTGGAAAGVTIALAFVVTGVLVGLRRRPALEAAA